MNKKITQHIVCTCFFFICTTALFCLTVDKSELESTGTEDSIVFENYTGPHEIINTADEIRAIGEKLAPPVVEKKDSFVISGQGNFYRIYHIVDPTTNEKFDADIFVIGPYAKVDHIDNVRRIIATYLEKTYDYTNEDAKTLATFITVYNAVYYKQLDSYKAKYKSEVITYLNENSCGMSTNYKDWPGKTQIVIPLSDIQGGLSTIETSVISDKSVVESMQETDDKAIDVRKDMVDIKEREAEIASEQAQEAQQKATEAKQTVTDEKNALEVKTETVENAQKKEEEALKEAEIAKEVADKNPEDKELQKEAEKKEEIAQEKTQELKEAETAVVEQKEVIKEAEEKAQEAQQEATEKQAIADKKQTEAQKERVSIAKDQLEVMEKEQANNEAAITTHALLLKDEKALLSSLVTLDAQTGKLIKESALNVIRNRMIFANGNNYTAIAGENVGNATVKLVTLDATSMEIIKESSESIAEDSVLVSNDADFYAVLQDGTKYVVGKFDKDLNLVLKSELDVMSATPIVITQKGIGVTDSYGVPKLLNTGTLEEITQ